MFDQIIKIICEGEKLTFDSLLGENRKEEIVYARQLIMYFAKIKKIGSLSFIGNRLGKDHATVLHSVKSINNYIATDKEKRERISQYEKKLDRVKNILTVKTDIEKLLSLSNEISTLEQSLIFIRLAIDRLLEETKSL